MPFGIADKTNMDKMLQSVKELGISNDLNLDQLKIGGFLLKQTTPFGRCPRVPSFVDHDKNQLSKRTGLKNPGKPFAIAAKP